MDFFVWGELERLVCREDPRYRQPEGASEALLDPYLPAPKAIQALTKRLKGCIARRDGRFELRPK